MFESYLIKKPKSFFRIIYIYVEIMLKIFSLIIFISIYFIIFMPKPIYADEISEVLIPQRNYITSYGLDQPKSTTILCRPLLYDQRSSINNKIISNPNIKFTSLLDNTKIDFLLTQIRSASDNAIAEKPKVTVLLNANGKYYETVIKQETKIEDLTEEQLILELVNRGLFIKANSVEYDGNFKIVPIKLKNGEEFLLNKTKHNVKVTPLGQAYVEKLKKQIYQK